VAVVNADGTGAQRLIAGHAPTWSPDGRWIAFVDFESGDRRTLGIFVVRADGIGRRQVFRNAVRTTFTRGVGEIREGGPMSPLLWSPDGQWIVFSRVYDGGTSIWRVDVESALVEPVTRPDR
jgi:Tol biopolymer transport system component